MGGDLIDFTMLARKGILARAKARDLEDRHLSRNDGDIIDFSNSMNSSSMNPSSGPSLSSPSVDSGNPLASFFGAVDSPSSPSSSAPSMPQFSSTPLGSFSPSVSSNSDDVSALRIKLDDNEFKLQRALDRIDELERKLSGLNR